MAASEPYGITAFASPHMVVRIHPSLAHGTGLVRGQTCECTFGKRAQFAVVDVDSMAPQDQVIFSSGLIDQLLMDAVWADSQAILTASRIQVQPLIGILCNPRWNRKKDRLVRTTQLPALEKLAETGAKLGATCFLMRVDDVDFTRERVKGYVLRRGQFIPAQFPLPDAIYDQVISRRIERTKEHAERRQRLSKLYGERIFNDGFFDKWQVYEWLRQDSRVKQHLPATLRYTTSQAAALFVQRHDTTYLKPIHGSLGLGIVRLTKSQDGSIQYDIKRRQGDPLHGRLQSPLEAVKLCRRRFGSKPYLLQEGVSLMSYQGRPFDIRILLQRDGTGEWKRTKMFARVSRSGEITSNLSSGGEAMAVPDVLTELYPSAKKRQQCSANIRRVSKLVAEAMESQAKRTFGELGIDIGVDDSGHVWLIEVNSKPWKAPSTEKGRQDLVDLAFIRPLQYAIRLAQNS